MNLGAGVQLTVGRARPIGDNSRGSSPPSRTRTAQRPHAYDGSTKAAATAGGTSWIAASRYGSSKALLGAGRRGPGGSSVRTGDGSDLAVRRDFSEGRRTLMRHTAPLQISSLALGMLAAPLFGRLVASTGETLFGATCFR